MSATKRISAIAIATLMLAACSTTTATPAGKLLETTKATKTIAVGTEGTYRPYSYTDESGNLAGIEVDIMKLLAKDLGADVKFTVAPWDGLIAGVDAGKYPVVINNLAVSDERKENTISPCHTRVTWPNSPYEPIRHSPQSTISQPKKPPKAPPQTWECSPKKHTN